MSCPNVRNIYVGGPAGHCFLQLEIQTQISITHLASVKCKCRFVVRFVIVVNDVWVSNMEVF